MTSANDFNQYPIQDFDTTIFCWFWLDLLWSERESLQLMIKGFHLLYWQMKVKILSNFILYKEKMVSTYSSLKSNLPLRQIYLVSLRRHQANKNEGDISTKFNLFPLLYVVDWMRHLHFIWLAKPRSLMHALPMMVGPLKVPYWETRFLYDGFD